MAIADKNLGVFTGFLAGFAWKGTETFKQARPACHRTGSVTQATFLQARACKTASEMLKRGVTARKLKQGMKRHLIDSRVPPRICWALWDMTLVRDLIMSCCCAQISLKNQWLVSRDWLKTKLLGRDISDV